MQRWPNEQSNVAPTIVDAIAPKVGIWLADCHCASWDRGNIVVLTPNIDNSTILYGFHNDKIIFFFSSLCR